jgi:uncharacterized protein YkwD
MVHVIKEKNLFQLVRQSAKEIGIKTLSAYSLTIGLFVVITITFILAQKQQDLRQRAAETTYTNCSISGFTIDSEENKILSYINAYRQQNGLSTISLSSYLDRAAEWKSRDMVSINDISKLAHVDSTGRGYQQMIYDCGYPVTPEWVGENIGANNSKDQCNGGSKVCTADVVFQAWKDSANHNANLLSNLWTKIGIARNVTSSGIWYWSTEFGGYNDGTNGSYIASTQPTPTPAVVAPNPSSNLTCVNSTPGTVTFNWTQQQSNMCYELYYTYSGGAQPVSAGCNISSYTIPGFSSGLSVTWQVRAYSGSNIGPYTSPLTFTVPSSCSGTNTPTPSPTPSSTSSTPHLLLWTATCNTDGTSKVAFNWTGSDPYGFTLSWGSPTLGTDIQTIYHAVSGTPYSGFSSGVDVEYQVWGNNSSGTAIYQSDNGSFIQTTPQCLVSAISTPTPTPTRAPTPTPTKTPTPTQAPYTPTPTPISSAPHLLLWNAYCSNGTATVAFNWSGINLYGYTLKWGSPYLSYNTQTVAYATSGKSYPGFSSNVGVEYQVWANNSSGIATTPSDNGSFIQTTPSCAVSTPTPTTAPVSSCPNYDPYTGYNNICSVSPCPGGSTLYKSGTGNAACAAAYGSTYGTCCMVTQPNGCPGESVYTCRQNSCSYGETNLSTGNAACAYAYGWRTGYCCY